MLHFRRHIVPALLVAGALTGIHLPSHAWVPSPSPSSEQHAPARPAKKPARPGFTEYQIAAGTALPIELRTRLSSSTNQPSDAVEGRLLRPLTVRDVELVPAGSTVLGTVTHSEAATVQRGARIAFTFHVIEHPESGSRATIRSSVVSYQSEPRRGKTPVHVSLEKGTDATVTLLAPLLVRIPD